jgi:hypothetical protein
MYFLKSYNLILINFINLKNNYLRLPIMIKINKLNNLKLVLHILIELKNT